MTIKEATQEMLRQIEIANVKEKQEKGLRGYDKDIAKELNLTKASYSRLKTGVTKPQIMTWYRITNLYQNYYGVQRLTTLFSYC